MVVVRECNGTDILCERWNVSSFTEGKYMYHHTNEKQSLFVLYNIKMSFRTLN